MYTIQLRNLPKDIYEGLKQSALESRRSMTQEVIYFIEKGLQNKYLEQETLLFKKNALNNIQELHKKEPLQDLEEAINWIKEDRER